MINRSDWIRLIILASQKKKHVHFWRARLGPTHASSNTFPPSARVEKIGLRCRVAPGRQPTLAARRRRKCNQVRFLDIFLAALKQRYAREIASFGHKQFNLFFFCIATSFPIHGCLQWSTISISVCVYSSALSLQAVISHYRLNHESTSLLRFRDNVMLHLVYLGGVRIEKLWSEIR